MSEYLADNVKRLREEQRMPATELAKKVSELGTPMTRMGIQRLERHERRVELDEIGALAEALGVPPVALFLPLSQAAGVQVSPGRVVDMWSALKWFSGRQRLDNEGKPADEWSHVRIYEEHERLVNELLDAHADVALFPATDDDPEKKAASRRRRTALRDLSFARAAMTRRGLPLPEVGADLEPLLEQQQGRWMPIDDWLSLPPGERPKLVDERDLEDDEEG